ncbi:MAG: transketolase [Magnetococcales bacterium]|nr:transketolase [Magnetococcales bacterium]
MRKTCLDAITRLADRDPRVVFIGSDLGSGTMEAFRQRHPERFFMEGISEQAVIGMAAGLAMDGFIPYVNTIATFLSRRALEQVCIDLCLHRLPVRLIGNGGGLVYAPQGPTHLAFEDIALLSALPNMTVVAPCDADEMRRLIPETLAWPGPLYVRLAKGGDAIISRDDPPFAIGRAILLASGEEIAFLTCGIMAQRAMAARDLLAREGITASVIHLPTVKPLDRNAVIAAAGCHRLLITLEEHSLIGGLGAAVADILLASDLPRLPQVRRLALEDAFPDHYGSQEELLEYAGLHPEGIATRAMAALKPRRS